MAYIAPSIPKKKRKFLRWKSLKTGMVFANNNTGKHFILKVHSFDFSLVGNNHKERKIKLRELNTRYTLIHS